jgi:hypothetical protein
LKTLVLGLEGDGMSKKLLYGSGRTWKTYALRPGLFQDNHEFGVHELKAYPSRAASSQVETQVFPHIVFPPFQVFLLVTNPDFSF